MASTAISDAVVFPQDDGTGVPGENASYDSAAGFGALARNTGASYKEGAGLANLDTTNETVDVGSGVVYIREGGNTLQSGAQTAYDTTLPEDMVYTVVLPTSTTVALDADTQADVRVVVDPTAQDTVTIEHNTSPTNPALVIGNADSSSGGTFEDRNTGPAVNAQSISAGDAGSPITIEDDTDLSGSSLTDSTQTYLDLTGDGNNLRLATGNAIEDGGGTNRIDFPTSLTRISDSDGVERVDYSGSGTYMKAWSGKPFILEDSDGGFSALKYSSSSTAPGTLELSNATLDANGNKIVGVGGTTDANSGAIRMAHASQIAWRNSAGTDDAKIYYYNDNYKFDGAGDGARLILSSDSASFLGSSITDVGGTTSANSGDIRLANDSSINWRDSGDTANMGWTLDGNDDMVYRDGINALDVMYLESGGNVEIPNGNLDVSNGVIYGQQYRGNSSSDTLIRGNFGTGDTTEQDVRVTTLNSASGSYVTGLEVVANGASPNVEIPNGDLGVAAGGIDVNRFHIVPSWPIAKFSIDRNNDLESDSGFQIGHNDNADTLRVRGATGTSGNAASLTDIINFAPSGNVEIPNGDLLPDTAGTGNIGTSTTYWNEMHATSFVSHSPEPRPVEEARETLSEYADEYGEMNMGEMIANLTAVVTEQAETIEELKQEVGA